MQVGNETHQGKEQQRTKEGRIGVLDISPGKNEGKGTPGTGSEEDTGYIGITALCGQGIILKIFHAWTET